MPSLTGIPENHIIFLTDMKTWVAVRTALRRTVSNFNARYDETDFACFLYDDESMADMAYAQKLARAISYFTDKPVYVCNGNEKFAVTVDSAAPVQVIPIQYGRLFESKHLNSSNERVLPGHKLHLKELLENYGEKAILPQLEVYLEVTEANARILEITEYIYHLKK